MVGIINKIWFSTILTNINKIFIFITLDLLQIILFQTSIISMIIIKYIFLIYLFILNFLIKWLGEARLATWISQFSIIQYDNK